MHARPRIAQVVLSVLAGANLVCSHPVPPPQTPAPSAQGTATAGKSATAEPMPHLRTGALAPEQVAQPLALELVARSLDKNLETLLVKLKDEDFAGNATPYLEQPDDRPRPWLGFGSGFQDDDHTLVIRRAAVDADQPVRGRVFVANEDRPGRVYRFELPITTRMAPGPKAQRAWAQALAHYLSWHHTAWYSYAARRVEDMFLKQPQGPAARGKRSSDARGLVTAARRNPNDVARLMETTTGMTSIQEALQTDRTLLVAGDEKPTVELATLKGPPLRDHPWAEMSKRLGRPPVPEPLAAATPADFYFVRFRNFEQLMLMLDRLDAWITPAANMLSETAEDRDLPARYEAQLGLGRSAVARMLGPSVITDVAVVGSDPYLREGSDLTFIFRVKAKSGFDMALASALAGHGARHGGLQSSRLEQDGVAITVSRSPDGAVRQHRASVDGFELVSNSPSAIRRVIGTLRGHQPRLADEADFRYMTARDASVPADVLAFMGDRFIAAVAGPAQKILEARRQVALAQLSTPGYAALLHGWIYGRAPESTEQLLAGGVLDKADLAHSDGEPIDFAPGRGARSSWGTPAALTPLIDRPPLQRVTPVERDAYDWFARGYQEYWRRYIDPAALRVAFDAGAPGGMQVDLRVLPLIDASEYREMERTVGRARVNPGPPPGGLRTALGIGAEAHLRRMARDPLKMMRGAERLNVDWMGSWAALGIDDSPRFASLLLAEGDRNGLRQRPRLDSDPEPKERIRGESDLERALANLPVYGAVALRSQTAAAVFLTGVRTAIEQSAPGMIQWGEAGRERDVPLVEVRSKGDEVRDSMRDVALYYAFCKGVLFLSLNQATLRSRIDECLDGRVPSAVPDDKAQSSPQWTIDLALPKDKPLWNMAVWLLNAMGDRADQQSHAMTEIAWRAAPGSDAARVRALSLAYLGMVPVSSDGSALSFGPEGVIDPLRGSAHAPRWPELPIAGSPIARLLDVVGRVRSEVAFDDEPTVDKTPMRSLHAHLTIAR